MLRELFGAPAPKKTAPVEVKPPAPAAQTVLGAGTHFEGTLRAEGSVRVDGTFLGDISTKGRIVIGEQGKVDGDLVGETVDVAGMVKGDVTARKISVARTGRILGELRLEKLTTEEGGFIQGLVRMEETVVVADYLPAQPESAEVKEAAKEEVKATPKAEAEPVKEKVPVKTGK